MPTVPLQHPECCAHRAGVRIVTDHPHRSPDFPELPFMLGVPPSREPTLEPRLHVECTDLMQPPPLPGKPHQTPVIIAHQSDDSPVHIPRDLGKSSPPVLQRFSPRQDIKDNEVCHCPLHRSQENGRDHNILSSTLAVQGIRNGDERCGGGRGGGKGFPEEYLPTAVEASLKTIGMHTLPLRDGTQTSSFTERVDTERGTLPLPLTTTTSRTNGPRPTAGTALPSACSDGPHIRVATGRFGMQRTVSRELSFHMPCVWLPIEKIRNRYLQKLCVYV